MLRKIEQQQGKRHFGMCPHCKYFQEDGCYANGNPGKFGKQSVVASTAPLLSSARIPWTMHGSVRPLPSGSRDALHWSKNGPGPKEFNRNELSWNSPPAPHIATNARFTAISRLSPNQTGPMRIQ
jgi:hypothetical protein